MKKILNKKLAISFLLLFLVIQFYPFVEYTYGAVDTDDVIVTLTVTAGIALTAPADIALDLDTSVNTSVGSAIWNVKTNNYAGYSLTVHTGAESPAMVRSGGGGNVADYVPDIGETPEVWNPDASTVWFGYSARGANALAAFKNGTGDTDCIAAADVPSDGTTNGLLWRDFDLTASADQVATLGTKTATAGVDTEVCVAVEQKGIYADSGTYTTTVTATATTL